MRFGTLGSEHSNHALVLRRYLAFRGLDTAEVVLYESFAPCFESLARGELDFVLQVSVHPSHAECVARNLNRLFLVDTFIAHSHPLAVLTRSEVEQPRSIGLQAATRDYLNLDAWPEQIFMSSTTAVAEALMQGRCDSGITARSLSQRHPGRFRVEHEIGAIQDAWVLFGREPLEGGTLVAWPDAPVTRQFIDRA